MQITRKRLLEMALSRSDAISHCIGKGKEFIQHFDKLYHNPKSIDAAHWAKEMQAWYNDVNLIKLKTNSKKLLSTQLSDWFFTAGAEAKDFMENPTDREIELYDKLQSFVLANRDCNVFETLKAIFNFEGE